MGVHAAEYSQQDDKADNLRRISLRQANNLK
jgi:hypothetical protein